MQAWATAWFAHLRAVLKRRPSELETTGVHVFQTESATPSDKGQAPVRAVRKPVDPARHLIWPI